MRIHMIGIGGIGMSALAQLYVHDGEIVSGSDREVSPTTELLERAGVHVRIGQAAENVPADAELVVYSDAVWDDNAERIRAKELGVRQISYFEALGEVSKGKRTIAVTGTHGKTTTTAMLAKILKDAGKEPTAIVGSIVPEFASNFLASPAEASAKAGGGVFVVEACEYRDHVLKLSPTILVLTNVEWDHTDWFPSLEALQEMFGKAIAALPADGFLVTNPQNPNIAPLLSKAKCTVIDYTKEIVPELQLIGEFNRANARAAAAAARIAFPDIPADTITHSLASFKGTWRRFEIKGTTKDGALVIDDYAHHPTAIRATLQATREKFPGKKIIVAFHPHLYTRTRDLMEEFAAAFVDADEVFIAPIYPAREEAIPGITAETLAQKITAAGIPATGYSTMAEVESALQASSLKLKADGIIFTMGAGDIYKVADFLVARN